MQFLILLKTATELILQAKQPRILRLRGSLGDCSQHGGTWVIPFASRPLALIAVVHIFRVDGG